MTPEQLRISEAARVSDRLANADRVAECDRKLAEAEARVKELEMQRAKLYAEIEGLKSDLHEQKGAQWMGEVEARERVKELEQEVAKWKEEHHFQACLTKEFMAYQDRAVLGERRVKELESENRTLRDHLTHVVE